jgi:HK97 family phage prohead protease
LLIPRGASTDVLGAPLAAFFINQRLEERKIETLALFGYVTYYNKTTGLHEGSFKRVLSGAFSKTLKSGARIEFLLNHQDMYRVGSNRDVLELYDHEGVGLAMRAKIPRTENGKMAREMAVFGYNAASIGFDYHGAVKQQQCIEGVWTTCIVQAKLFEVSFCAGYQGAVPNAYVAYGEVDYSKSLQEECLSGKLRCEGAAVGMTRALQRLL